MLLIGKELWMPQNERAISRLVSFADTLKGFAALYTVLFAVVLLICMAPLLLNDRSMIWSVDGLEQAYVWFLAVGDWFRRIAENVFMRGFFELPLWNPAWGYGADQYVSLAMFLFDPFYLLSIFTPQQASEFMFQFAIIARLFVAGLAFAWYARSRGARYSSVLVGALAYVFAASGMVSLQQGFLLNGFIFFPLLLLGSEWVLEKKSPILLIASIAWAFLVQFYIAYVAIIFLVPYCVVRYRGIYGSFRLKPFLLCFLRTAFYCLLGIALSGVALLPVALSMFGMDRIGLEREIPLIYDVSYYAGMVKGFITHFEMQGDVWYGFGPFGFVCLVLLVLRRKQHRALFLCVLTLLAFHLVPLVCSALNGFQYPGNRWIFVTDFALAYATVKLIPDLPRITKIELRFLIGSACVYGAFVFVYPFSDSLYAFAIAFAILLLMVMLIGASRGKATAAVSIGLVPLMLIAVIGNYWNFISPTGDNKAGGQVATGSALSAHLDAIPFDSLAEASDDSTWRIDSPLSPRNNGLATDVPEVSFYSSLYNSWVDRFHTGLGLVTADLNYSYYGLNERYGLEALMGVRYYSGSGAAPYSYDKQVEGASGVFESSDALPLAFVYEEDIPESEYDALSALEKQQALLQGVVLEEDILPDIEVEDNQKNLPFTMVHRAADGSIIKDSEENAFFVGAPGETLEIEFTRSANAETYLTLSNMECAYLAPTDRYSPEAWEDLDPLQKNLARVAQANEYDDGRYSMSVASEGSFSRLNFYAPYSALFGGKNDWTCNLGFSSQEGRGSAIIAFNKAGIYRFEDIELSSLPVVSQEVAISLLRDRAAQSADYQGNTLSIEASLDDDGVLFASVPYSSGWSVEVDGKSAEVLRANVAFLGVSLDSGDHEVVFRYETPGLRQGALLSMCAAFVLAVVLVVRRARRVRC